MVVKVDNFTGHEDNCEFNYYDANQNWVKRMVFEEMDYELYINQRGNNDIKLNSCVCTLYDEQSDGVVINLKPHQILAITEQLKKEVDWEEWEQMNDTDVDDFMLNELD